MDDVSCDGGGTGQESEFSSNSMPLPALFLAKQLLAHVLLFYKPYDFMDFPTNSIEIELYET